MTYLSQKSNVKKNAIGFSIVLALHLALLYAFLAGLGHRMIDVVAGPLETKIVAETKPPPPPPPAPPQVKLVSPPPPYIPLPVVNVTPPPVTHAITAVTRAAPVAPVAFRPAVAAPAAPATPDTDVSEVPIGGATAQYPEEMLDDQRQGWAEVECIVGTNGKTSDCSLLQTKGGYAFGASALRFAQTETYRPATHNGAPVEKRRIWHINFTLN